MNRKIIQKVRGFTLMELLVALFIFSIVMMATAQIFAKAYSGYHMTKRVQHDLENAQYAINILAKKLRTSSVVSGSGSQQYIQFFDHSPTPPRCIRYRISSNALEVAESVATDVSQCDSMSLSSFVPVTTGTVTGSFLATESAPVGGPPTRVGKVTISLSVSEDAAHSAHIQTTISLRDFGNIDL